MPASPAEYQEANTWNGVLGSAKAHAQKANVAANISHTGQVSKVDGRGLPASRILLAKITQTTRGVATKKHQNAIHCALCEA